MPEYTPEGDVLPEPPDNSGERDGELGVGPSRGRVAPFVALALAIVLGGLFLVLSGAKSNRAASAATPLLGQPAPESIGELDGRSFDLARRKGSWVVLNFFDPSCVPCVQEHPELVSFSQDHNEATDGVELITVVNSSNPEDVAGFFAANGGDWPVVYDDDGSISDAFAVSQVPETWIIDPDGIVRFRTIAQVTDQELVAVLLRLRTATPVT